MSFAAIGAGARAAGLMVMGGFHPDRQDGAPEGSGTLVLLGPDGKAFWEIFRASPEYGDGQPDPVDRWSRRIVGRLAAEFGATPLYPFTGPPWHPFISWALRTGQAWISPVGFMVHARAGLFASFRGALALPRRLDDLPPAATRPCDSCDAPCRGACPVGAPSPAGYDAAACHRFLDTGAGRDCLVRGCAVRRACPVGRDARAPTQSAFHMAAFHATKDR